MFLKLGIQITSLKTFFCLIKTELCFFSVTNIWSKTEEKLQKNFPNVCTSKD